MFKMLYRLIHSTPHQQRQDDIQAKTHETLNDLQRAMIAYQQKSRKDRAKIIQMLTSSEQELNSVAEKIAVATGNNRRPTT